VSSYPGDLPSIARPHDYSTPLGSWLDSVFSSVKPDSQRRKIFVASLSGSNFVSRLTDCRAGAKSSSSGCGKVIVGLEWIGVAARIALADQNGKQTHAGRVVGSVIEIGGTAYGLTRQYGSIQNCAEETVSSVLLFNHG
jgi:hypothetical protein